jgi:predicted acylesterase/phospholipase RssA
MNDGHNGKILTFYSYKGGTGRSMLLANIAWLLACSGKKVLAIDWDLEAPGLHRYFYPFLQDKELVWSDGLINFVDDYKTHAMTPPDSGEEVPNDWYLPHADIRQYAVSLQWDFPGNGRLDFVPAGKQDETYGALVNSFNWEDFYKRLAGNKFLEAAAALMRRNYEYVLIDSRTGVSDTSGICTIKLPDTLVVCFTLNHQSINGASAIADYVYDQRVTSVQEVPASLPPAPAPNGNGASRFNIFPVPMRLEDAQTRKLERRREYARSRKFARYPIYLHQGTRQDYWENVPLRYYSFYAYEEILAAFGEKERDVNSLLASVQRVTAYLTEGKVDPTLTLPQPRRDEILREFEGETYEVVATAPFSADRVVEDALMHLTPQQQDAARRVLLRLVRVAGPNEAEHSRQRVPLGDFDPSAKAVVETLRGYQVLVAEKDPLTAADVVQLAPDVPIQTWPRLQGWIDAERDFLIWRQTLRALAERWDQARPNPSSQAAEAPGQATATLLTGGALTRAVKYLRSRPADLTTLEKAFIETSLAAETVERETREAAQRKDLERQRAEQIDEERHKRAEEEKARRRKRPALANVIERWTDVRRPPARVPPQSAEMLQALDVLNGKLLAPRELFALARKLKNEQAFSTARRLLARALADPILETDKPLRLRVYQEAALCTYKDTDLPADERLDLALDLLRRADELATTKNQETLGLAGAVHKRKWELTNQKQHLEQSLHYYMRGYREDPANDQGYTGINAAYVLDQLAHLEADAAPVRDGGVSPAEQRRAEARRIREDIFSKVAPLVDRPQNDWLAGAWWFYSTVAEALFGLGRYADSVRWLERGRSAVGQIPEWEYKSTLQQLARLAVLQSADLPATEFEYTEAFGALREFFNNDAAAVRGAFMGKVGVALSGGGFRAALYHIGVLAKLAEMDVLRHVEVLSCVSGGSIVGAHYYLEVRKLLHSKPDAEITRQDYIDIVKRLERDFVGGVQRNVRTRVAAEFLTNAAMVFRAAYSRTQRVGELYEREIFSRVQDGEEREPRWLGEINIRPLGEPETFAPKLHNWRRQAKAPILLLNATALNTGHNWQFTTTWMGEPPGRIDTNVDGNEQLRRMYYWQAPERHRQVRLGHAVAASSCVPGLFEPLVLDGLYPDRVVRLVDGGVCDNQGVSGLLEQDCTVILTSDGSGQSESRPNPSESTLGVLLRSDSILQARVRDAQYQELRARRRASLVRGLMFVHLKQDLDVDPVDWVDCPDPSQASDDARPPSRRGPLTRYGIAKEVQALLAGIRTDLDSFTDVESAALMASGYRMTELEFKSSYDLGSFQNPAEPVTWDFLAVESGMKGSGRKQTYMKRMLRAGSALSFKVWRLSRPLQVLAGALAISLAATLGWLVYTNPDRVLMPAIDVRAVMWWAASTGVVAALTYAFGKTVVGLLRWRDTLSRIAVGIGMSLFGCLLARLHLIVFDRLFLRLGSFERFQKQE